MIGKGNHHADGVKLAAYLMSGHRGERAELIEVRGFGPVSDLRDGFHIEQIRASCGTRADKPFFHVQFRGAHGEGLKLTTAQQLEIADRCDRALNLVGQPRAASLHINEQTGDRHLHLGYSLVAEGANGRLFVKKMGLYKNKLKRLSREIERDYGLKIVSSERQAGQALAADRKELEQSRRLGTDGPAIRSAILDCLQKSDGGKSFKAALEAQDLMLANGDRRDCFVVIDAAGGHHALNKGLTGQTLAQMRDRLADLDRSQLPGVAQAQAMQAARQHEQKAAQEGRQQAEHPSGAEILAGQERAAQAPEKRPLGKTAAQINAAWNESRNPSDLAASAAAFRKAIEERGTILVYVSAGDRVTAFARESGSAIPATTPGKDGPPVWMQQRGGIEALSDAHRESAERSYERWIENDPTKAARHDLADYVGYVQGQWEKNQQTPGDRRRAGNGRMLKEGFAVVDARGTVTRIDERTTGDKRAEIDARLASIDRSQLLTVAAARDVMKEANKAAWRAERQAEREMRPANWIESRIAECADQARIAGAVIARSADGERATLAEIIADRLKPDGDRTLRAATVQHGSEAFAARLEQAGITLARVTQADLPMLDGWRQDEERGRQAAETNSEARKAHRFDALEDGALAAVTRNGDVYRINPEKIRGAHRQLDEQLPSVSEARAGVESERSQIATLWTDARDEALRARGLNAANREAERQDRATDRQQGAAAASVEDAVDQIFSGLERAFSRAMDAAAAPFESIANFLGDMLAATAPPTAEQVAGIERAADEAAEAHARAAPQQAWDAARVRDIDENVRQQQNEQTIRYSRFGTIRPVEQPREQGQEQEIDREK
jgi:hypothetical protein